MLNSKLLKTNKKNIKNLKFYQTLRISFVEEQLNFNIELKNNNKLKKKKGAKNGTIFY